MRLLKCISCPLNYSIIQSIFSIEEQFDHFVISSGGDGNGADGDTKLSLRDWNTQIKFISKFNVVVRIRINYTLKYVLITCHTSSSPSNYGLRAHVALFILLVVVPDQKRIKRSKRRKKKKT